jgi:hypothetical protein
MFAVLLRIARLLSLVAGDGTLWLHLYLRFPEWKGSVS